MKGFVERLPELKQKVDSVICTAVNDHFVLGAWARATNAQGIVMLSDGNAEFAKAVGLTMDVSAHGMGMRGQRYALIAEDGVVKYLGLGGLENSGVEAVLKALE